MFSRVYILLVQLKTQTEHNFSSSDMIEINNHD